MAKRWGDHITKEKTIKENTLCCCNHNAEYYTWVSLFEEEEQVHALVFCFLEQMVNPSIVSFKGTKTSQVSAHASNHSWNTSDGLKKYYSVHPLPLLHRFWVIT